MSEDGHVTAPVVRDTPDNQDDPKGSTTVVIGTISCLLLLAGVIALEGLYHRTARAENERKIVNQQPIELRQVQNDQLEQLTTYRWVDQANGVVAIPIERAMELMVEEARENPE